MGYPGSDKSPRELYKEMSVDDLASFIVNLKEQSNALRQSIWYAEDELRDRLIANNAKVLQGNEFRVRSSVKRETVWDQVLLAQAYAVARIENVGALFQKAFPQTFDCSVRNLNELLKLGGKTAEAIEAAKAEVKEKVELTVEKSK